MFDAANRKKPSRKIEDVLRPWHQVPEEPTTPDMPPPPPTTVRMSHAFRRRVSFTLVGLILVALGVGVAQGGTWIWRFAGDQLGLVKVFGITPIGSRLLSGAGKKEEYPKTFTGLVTYIRDFLENAQDFLRPSLRIAGEARTFAGLAPYALTGEKGREFMDSMKRLRDAVASFNAENAEQARTADIGGMVSQGLDLFKGRSEDIHMLLSEAVLWLEHDKPRHVAVLFGNTGEMRPGGGFIGSYAEVTIEGGAVKSITVHDINDVDRGFDQDIVPPRELQPLVGRWRAADANWFFNFPDSAERILGFMNASALYVDRDIQLDGVIALSPQVIGQILEVTGPIELPDGTKIDSGNFLKAIQSDVQEGHDSGSDNPKAIIAEMVPAVLQKLSPEGGAQGGAIGVQLFGIAYAGLEEKSILAYFTDKGLENIVDRYGWSGRLFDLPRNFAGDYVGVTMSNIGGAKTDVVINNTVAIKETFLPSGLLETNVRLARAHKGDEEEEWWYRAPYEGYVQVFTPPDVEVLGASGMWDRKLAPKSYGQTYVRDPLVAQIEKTKAAFVQFAGLFGSEESGRDVLSFWQRIERGTTGRAELDYVRPLSTSIRPGAEYTFVIERQPAATARYELEIVAPPGYVWEENQSAAYTYKTDDLPGRYDVTLTLAREE